MIRVNTLRTTVEVGGACGCPIWLLEKATNTWVPGATTMLTGRGFTVTDGGSHWQIANPYIRSLDITNSTGTFFFGRLLIVSKAGYDTLEAEPTLAAPAPTLTYAPTLYAQFVPKVGSVPTSKEYWQWSSGPPNATFYLQDSPALPGLTPWTPGGHPDNRVFPYKVFPSTPELWASQTGTNQQWQIQTKISGQLQHVGDLVTINGGLAADTHHWYGNSVALVNSLLVKGSDGKWVFSKMPTVTPVNYRRILVDKVT